MFRSLLGKATLYSLSGALAALTAAGPVASASQTTPTTPDGGKQHWGKVVETHKLPLRQEPTAGSRVYDTVPGGTHVRLLCRTGSPGSGQWYLVHTDYYAWAPAQHVATRGQPPERC